MKNYDLIIIGAGPAGLCLASELSGSDLKILLLDKKKNAGDVHYNTSGSFINPQEWNLPDYILNPINEMYFSSYNKAIKKNINCFVIDRKKLLVFFEEKAKENKNFEVKYESVVEDMDFNEKGIDRISYIKNNEIHKVSSRLYVDCSGTGLVFASKLKPSFLNVVKAVGIEFLVPLKKESHTADLFVGSKLRGGYGYIFPVSLGFAIVGYGTLEKENFQNIESYLKDMWKIKRVSKRCDLNLLEKKTAVLRTGKPFKKFTKKNLLIIGDAAVQANPLAGEGLRFVMDSAKIAAKWIERSLSIDLKLLENYNKEWNDKYYQKYKLAFFIQNRIKKASKNDKKLDFGVNGLGKISDKDFERLMSGDLSYSFLAQIAVKSFLKH